MAYTFRLLFSFLKKEWKLISIYFSLYIVLLFLFSKNQYSNFIILKSFLANFQFDEFAAIDILSYSLEIVLISYIYIKLLGCSINFSEGYLFSRLSLLKFFLYNLISSIVFFFLFFSFKYLIYCLIVPAGLIKIELFIFAIKEFLFLINIIMIINLLLLSYNKYLKVYSYLFLIYFISLFWKYSVISYSIYLYLFVLICLVISAVLILKQILVEHLKDSFFLKF